MNEMQGVTHLHQAMGQDAKLEPELWKSLPKHLIHEIVSRGLGFGQGVKELHRGMGQDTELDPKLWRTLPKHLIDKIVDDVLRGLPFSRVLDFCFTSKRWRGFLMSMEYLLFFHKSYECMIFNPRTGLWESMPLLFAGFWFERLKDMELVSCFGGLLYFENAIRDEFIVCNPLTRWYTTLSGTEVRRYYTPAELDTKGWNLSEWEILMKHFSESDPYETHCPSLMSGGPTLVSNSRAFDLYLCTSYDYTRPIAGDLRDSRRDPVIIAEIQSDFHYSFSPTFFPEVGITMLGFYHRDGKFRVLFYNIEEQRHFWCSQDSLENTVRNNRTALFATRNDRCQWEFLELRNGGLTLGRAPFPPPTEVLLKKAFRFVEEELATHVEWLAILNLVHVEYENTVYYVSLFRQPPGLQISISVLTNNLVDGSQRISNWMECRSSTEDFLRGRITAEDFHVFKPSLLQRPNFLLPYSLE